MSVVNEVISENQVEGTKKDYVVMTKENKSLDQTVQSVEMSSQTAEKVKEKCDDVIVEKDYICEASASKSEEEWVPTEKETNWNLKMIGADGVKKTGKGKVKIAILDSGVDESKDMTVKERVNLVEDEKNIAPYFEDVTSHGTSIGGIIKKINPNAEIYSVKVLDMNNKAPISRIVNGISWCIEHKINIINMSFGTSVKSEILENAVKRAKEAGILMIASAGNGGNDSAVEYPAAYSEVMAVGGVSMDGKKTEESAVGKQIEIMAPGEKIVSNGPFAGQIVVGGTSVAVPHVVGVASLLLQKDTSKSPEFIRALLNESSKKMNERKECIGNGLVDAEYALKEYGEFSKLYKENEKSDSIITDNTKEITSYDNAGLVEGRWSGHDTMVNEVNKDYELSMPELQLLKKGAALPDQIGRLDGNSFALLHGQRNYVANAHTVTRLALKGASCTVNSISTNDKEVTDAKNVLSKLRGLTAKEWEKYTGTKTPSSKQKKMIYYGVATHIAADAIAHKAYFKDGKGNWIHIDHANGADSPTKVDSETGKTYQYGTKQSFTDRYNYALYVTYRVLRAAKAEHQITYTAFVPETTTTVYKDLMKHGLLKIRNLKPHSYRENGGSMSDKTADAFLSKLSFYVDNGEFISDDKSSNR